jgi:hypothetical protein
MQTFMAVAFGIFKGIGLLVREFPWLKFAAIVFVTFFVGCLYGRRMRAEAPPVRVIQPERRPIFPRLREEPTEAPKLVPVPDAISTPKLPEAAETVRVPEPKATATVCVGGSCATSSRVKVQAMPQRRLFRWR